MRRPPPPLTARSAAATSRCKPSSPGRRAARQARRQLPAWRRRHLHRAQPDWSTGSTLTLNAFHDIYIDAPITVAGPGVVSLTGNAAELRLRPHRLQRQPRLHRRGQHRHAGQPHHQRPTLRAGEQRGPAGERHLANPTSSYALANSYDATSDGTYAAAAIPTTFTGTFEGLGNTISNLTISSSTAPADEGIGLFASVTGNISDLALSGGSLTGNANVGALAGFDDGNVSNVAFEHGGDGVLPRRRFDRRVRRTGRTLTNSSSTGNVVGVLVDRCRSGEPGAIGGLIGQLDAGSVTASYATGAVTALGGDQIGGLIGVSNGNNNVVVSNSYATGAVSAGPDPSSFSAGVSVGGLIGDNGGAVIDSYATGAVLGAQFVGGLIGINENDAPGTSTTNPTGDGGGQVLRHRRGDGLRRQLRQRGHRCRRPDRIQRGRGRQRLRDGRGHRRRPAGRASIGATTGSR